uniref:Uncharacterized protein n=1 Tax=Oryza sativa subsp. japonica TaxID=39947 RepID=Q6YXV9_ORYSJ|nr:hypothetical protein [Oryza sativa Japonica Group]
MAGVTFCRAEGAPAPPVSSPSLPRRRRGVGFGGKGKGGDGRESERIEAVAVLPSSRVVVFPSCSCRRREPADVAPPATVAAPPPSSLPPRLPASRRFALLRKREEEKEGDGVDYADMWGPCGSHVLSFQVLSSGYR